MFHRTNSCALRTEAAGDTLGDCGRAEMHAVISRKSQVRLRSMTADAPGFSMCFLKR